MLIDDVANPKTKSCTVYLVSNGTFAGENVKGTAWPSRIAFITLLFRGSAKAALLIAFLAGLSVLGQMVMPMISDVPRPPTMQVALLLCTSIVAAFCSVDLWSQWRKKAEPVSHSERP